ncbi:MAG: alpha-glucosidase C-terminal domain-containing protein [Ferruginibacter sp.]|nr:alpha-glucosidase C-terminal domain-containing protein [Ferruginibacter sp.]
MKKYFFIIISIIFLSCSKTDHPVNPGLSPALGPDPAQYGSPFTKVPTAKDAIIYQVNMRAFSAAGNLKGVTARLDSIKSLGANVLYLMPVFPVGTLRAINSPYAVKDYKAVGSEFGTLDDLRVLVDGAHSRNMAVILDWVANHTAWDNAWTSNKSWYRQDAAGNIVSPPGYNDVAQLNFSNDTMCTAMIEALRYWVFTANIDGYRCDFADNVPVSFWKQAITSLKTIPGRRLLYFAEGSRTENFRAGFDLNFGFAFFSKLEEIYGDSKSATQINDINKSEYLNVYDESQVVRYTTNHDVNSSDGTPQELFGGEKGSLGAFVIAAFMKAVPMIYSGQEVGTPYRIPFPFTAKKIDWSLNPGLTAEYKRILNFRNNSAAIRGGQLFSYSSDDVVAFTKEGDKEKVFVMVNLRNRAVDYTLPAALSNSSWINGLNGGNMTLTNKITLQPYSYLVLKNQ